MKEVQDLIDKAYEVALAEIIRLAREDLSSSNDTHEFLMAMGSYFFIDSNDNNMHYHKNKEIDKIISDHDELKLTGCAMRFKATGGIIKHW